jgi:uncharacterized OB-fold protein
MMGTEREYTKPLPVIDEASSGFWEACRRHELVAQQCDECGHRRWPIGPACTQCLSPRFSWVPVPGTGEIMSWIVYHHAFNAAFEDDLPYNVALIRLDDGYTMISNIVDALDDIAVGQPVHVVFDDVTDTVSIPRFARSVSS